MPQVEPDDSDVGLTFCAQFNFGAKHALCGRRIRQRRLR